MRDGRHPGIVQNALFICQEWVGNPNDRPPTSRTVVIEPALEDRKLSLTFGPENIAPPGAVRYVQVSGILHRWSLYSWSFPFQMDLSGSGKSYIVSHLTRFAPQLRLRLLATVLCTERWWWCQLQHRTLRVRSSSSQLIRQSGTTVVLHSPSLTPSISASCLGDVSLALQHLARVRKRELMLYWLLSSSMK